MRQFTKTTTFKKRTSLITERSKVLHKVHTLIQMRHLLAIAIKQQRVPTTILTDSSFGGLAPARMRNVRIHVGIKTVFMWRLYVPRGGRLTGNKRYLHH